MTTPSSSSSLDYHPWTAAASSSGSVQRTSRIRSNHVPSPASSCREESSTTMSKNAASSSTSSSESSPSKDKKNQQQQQQQHVCSYFLNTSPIRALCCGKRVSPSSAATTSRRRRFFSSTTTSLQSQHHHHSGQFFVLPPKWRQRTLVFSMCFFTFVLGWRMMLLHGELLVVSQQQEQDHYHQERLWETFVGHHHDQNSQGKERVSYPPLLRVRRPTDGRRDNRQQTQSQQSQLRQQERRRRTRPPPLDPATAQQYLQPPEYQLFDTDHHDDADMSSSSLSSSSSFSLNATTSRVVLVGMLSSSWGISLAMHLHQQYGISNIMGVDDMFPNVQPYRMALTNRYEYLARHLPNVTLWTPPPPRLLRSQRFTSASTSSHNTLAHQLQAFQPTHVVYLSPTVSLDRVLQSYHGDDASITHAAEISSSLPSNVTARLFDIRHRVQSLQRLLHALQVVYNNKNHDDSSPESPLGQQKASPPPRLVVASAASSCSLLPQHYQLDQVLVNTYLQQYGLAATHILVPPLYGTWLDDHDPLHPLIHQVLEESIFSHRVIDVTTADWMDNHVQRLGPVLLPPPHVPHYLHVDDVVQAVTNLLQQPPAAGHGHYARNHKMMILPPDTSWTSLRQAIRDTIQSGKDPRHNISQRDASSSAGDNQAVVSNVQQERVREMLAWKYVQDYPWRDPATYVANNASHWISNALPLEKQLPDYAHIPCACECSFLTICAKVPTAFDQSTVLATQQATEGAKFVVYTVNWDPSLTTLAPVPISDNSTSLNNNPALEAILASITAMTARVAFISDQSPLAQRYNVRTTDSTDVTTRNGQMEENGWKLVWLAQGRLTKLDRLLPKIAPSRLFATTINKAMYVASHKIDNAPILPALTYLMDHMVDGKAQRGKSRAISLTSNKGGKSQSLRWVFQEPAPARRAVLFAQEHLLKTPKSTTSLRRVAQRLWWSNNTSTHQQQQRQRQMTFYEHVMRLMHSTDRKHSNRHRHQHIPSHVSFLWVDTAIMVHNMHVTAARNLRCEWFGEHLSWHDDDVEDNDLHQPFHQTYQSTQREGMEELSLGYLIAKHRMEGRLGKPLVGDESWSPYFDLSKMQRQQQQVPPPRLVNGVGQEIFLRILSRPMGATPPSVVESEEDDEETDESDE